GGPRRVHDRRAAAGTVVVRRGVRAARRGYAAQRPDRRGIIADLAVEGRADGPRQRVLREARAWQGDVPRAADGAVLPLDLGRAPLGGAAPSDARGAGNPPRS